MDFAFMAARQYRYRATVLVLGDLGRSPRMLNHAVALAEDGADVSLAGYLETPVDNTVRNNPRIRIFRIRRLRRAPEGSPRIWFLLVTAIRSACLLFESLWVLLAKTPRADAILVQNPPTVPTLLSAWIAARLRGSLFLIDWHNLGYTMLVPRLEPSHAAVRLGRTWERWLGNKADENFCVSSAMRERLVHEFGLAPPILLRDTPRDLPPTLPIPDRSSTARMILARYGLTLPESAALSICPTSWTADEDMDLLLQGLQLWDSMQPQPFQLMVLITGQGPLRRSFEQRLSIARWQQVIVRTAFLDPEDYRHLLSAACFGLCLHRSSSGVDLPMKLMDLFGARTPACVLNYGPCLFEQVQPGVTALMFQSSQELAAQITQLLQGFPGPTQFLEQLQRNIEESFPETWRDVWQRQAAPVFHRVFGPS